MTNLGNTVNTSSFTVNAPKLDYFASIGAALAPVPRGSKDPIGIVGNVFGECSTDPAQWAAWETAFPGCNWVLLAGKSRLVIIDIDVKQLGVQGAWASWCKWCTDHGLNAADYPPQHHSPSGGFHVLFRVPDDVDPMSLRSPALVGPCEGATKAVVELKTANGYVVCPPSSYDGAKGGKAGDYRLAANAFAPYPLPGPMIEHCTRRKSKDQTKANPTGAFAPGIDPTPEEVRGDIALVQEFDAIFANHAEHPFRDYFPWLETGFGFKLHFGDAGFALWEKTFDARVDYDTAIGKWIGFDSVASSESRTIGSWKRRIRELKSSPSFMWRTVLQPDLYPPVAPTPTTGFVPLPVGYAPGIQPDQTPPGNIIQSSAEFVAGFRPPEYLLYGIMQREYLYSMTAMTGAGKTAVGLLLAAHVALGRPLGDREVQRGSVLYFAAENSVDVQARWIAMAEHHGFSANEIDVHFVAGATKLSTIAERITAEVHKSGLNLVLVIVDTSAATFEGVDENDNVAALEHAKRMRSLTLLPGNPTALVLCHPTKHGTDLLPRGGGAFLNEVDGNLTARKSDTAVEVSWAGKFRGVDFAPMLFKLETVTAARLRDKGGRQMPTVIARPLDEAARQVMKESGRRDEDLVLRAIDGHPKATYEVLAKALKWEMSDGKPYKVKVQRAAERLAILGLIMKHRREDYWVLTPDGQKELNRADTDAVTTRGTAVTGMPFPGGVRPH